MVDDVQLDVVVPGRRRTWHGRRARHLIGFEKAQFQRVGLGAVLAMQVNRRVKLNSRKTTGGCLAHTKAIGAANASRAPRGWGVRWWLKNLRPNRLLRTSKGKGVGCGRVTRRVRVQ